MRADAWRLIETRYDSCRSDGDNVGIAKHIKTSILWRVRINQRVSEKFGKEMLHVLFRIRVIRKAPGILLDGLYTTDF